MRAECWKGLSRPKCIDCPSISSSHRYQESKVSVPTLDRDTHRVGRRQPQHWLLILASLIRLLPILVVSMPVYCTKLIRFFPAHCFTTPPGSKLIVAARPCISLGDHYR